MNVFIYFDILVTNSDIVYPAYFTFLPLFSLYNPVKSKLQYWYILFPSIEEENKYIYI